MDIKNIKKESKPHSEVVLSGEVSKESIASQWESVAHNAMKEVELPGFRKGKAPKERVIEAYGKNALWREATEKVINSSLEDIFKEHEVAPIMPLGLSLQNAQYDEPVSFEIVAVVAPTCTIKNYTDVAKKALADLPAIDGAKEHADAKKAFRIQARGISKMQKGDVQEGDSKKISEEADTPMTDDEAKVLGFESGEVFEHFLEEEAKNAVRNREDQKRRSAIAEALLKEAECSVPRLFIEEEAKALVDATKRDVVSKGLEWSDYLKQSGKDETAVLMELKPVAEKRVQLDLIFSEIVRAEKIAPTEDDKKQEDDIAHRMAKEGVEHERAHSFAREQIVREKVWKLLIGKKEEEAVS
ncbi:hypothetical protein COU15_01820 [Candidatus Kaiserbacteria bacterium CG10_big_fil_rev_8_21_14_0_10_45_20]|uniref:Trigger factor n=1 Tax=Candidatus Kaiserbacteria bacterium CG10_big_fil_rev_8_21_14_0_10_45_20 TaxID=1974607 RepID=A0A2H0UH44_9BACT|nr:MAG: hypothetical protein COU15_01820 [Candidatus Kaiserbacteria bacterium CG10_big_fil_rev_8_21_14_0_10_45_20]